MCASSAILADTAPIITTQSVSQTVTEENSVGYNAVTRENNTDLSTHDYTFTMVGYESGGAKGSYNYDDESGVFSVWGCGNDVWGISDHFSYLFRPVSEGDFSLTVKMDDFVATSDGWAKAGLMLREGDSEGVFPVDSRYVSIHTQRASRPSDTKFRSSWRNSKGYNVSDTCTVIGPDYSYPNWQKIERVGNIVFCYYSENGEDWNLLSETDTGTWADGSIGSGLPLYVGMFVTSHVTSSSDACAYFSNVDSTGKEVIIAPPEIEEQPENQTVIEDYPVTFSVQATGTAPLTYQWYKDGIAISDATNPSYSIEYVGKADAGSYTVDVSNSAGSVTSEEVVLTVIALPTIVTQPKRQTVDTGDSVTFSVDATGPKALTYQWYKDGELISNATGTTYTIDSVQASDAGNYTVAVSNDKATIISDTAVLIVNEVTKVIITNQPKSLTLTEGDSVTFSVDAIVGNKDFTTLLSGVEELDMVWIEPGTYPMGSPVSELGRANNETRTSVIITNGFWIGRHEVTQAQYETITGKNPSKNLGVNNPVEQVTWYNASDFCSKLTESERAAGRLPEGYEYKLPTEAQWEYACRAGTATALNSGKDLTSTTECSNMDEVGWYKYNSNRKTHPVGQKQPNAWGLYDMHGNVKEWCHDRYHNGAYYDPVRYGARGGAYTENANNCRSAIAPQLRQHSPRQDPIYSDTYDDVGFRVVLVPVQTQENEANNDTDLLTYQWYKDGEAITNATEATYTINSAKNLDAGNYTVIVSNNNSRVISSAATLVIKAADKPVIITQPQSQTVNIGDSVSFSVEAEEASTGYKDFKTFLSGVVELDMVWIKPGTYAMGSPINELGRGSDETRTSVTITNGFWIGKYEVTQAQYEIITKKNPSNNVGDNNPVEKVTWYDADDFCSMLTESERAAGRLPDGYKYVLPTEAQWEYACRAGTTTALNSGKNLTSTTECPNMDEVGWYKYNSDGKTHPVGQKRPNNWGLYDMHGNVWEWCSDRYALDWNNMGTGFGIHGGAYADNADACRSACRRTARQDKNDYGQAVAYSDWGFRVALVPDGTQTTTSVELSYQWFKDGVAISGATDTSYTVENVQVNDIGNYTVVISNGINSTESEKAMLDVILPPTIIEQPVSQTVAEGDDVTFSVTAEGDNLSYQWFMEGLEILGATDSSYTIENVQVTHSGHYKVIVYNNAGSEESWDAILRVNAILHPAIITQPVSQTVDEGDSVTFFVEATGTGPLWYQWYKDYEPISGATDPSYTIEKAQMSDAGKYMVVVQNSVWADESNLAILTVNKPVVSDGTAVRSVKVDGQTATVTLVLTPGEDVSVYFVEETVPDIGTVVPGNAGVYTASKNVIRWSFLDGTARTVSYTVIAPADFSEKVTVSGEVAFDTTVKAIGGETVLDFTVKTHPADTNEDFEISMLEVSAYAVAWKQGKSWSREPVDIPMNYVARGALIWINGGDYVYDSSKAKPACWVNAVTKAAAVELASADVPERKINVTNGKANVAIEIVPAEGISVYFVEEQLPADVTLNVTDISDGGNYIAGKNVIRWSFLDGETRTLTYAIEPEAGFEGTLTLSGEVMLDEETFTIEGDSEAIFSPAINFVVEDDGETLVLDFEGILYESDDAINWRIVEGAKPPFTVDTSKGKKFYRSVK